MITVVTGPPCSGKTTYIRHHAKPGDLILDYDHIAQALGSPVAHDHPAWLREIAAAAWSAAVDQAIATHGAGRAWIVDSRPTRHRQQAYQRARAKVIALTADRDELHRRADADNRGDEGHKRIDDWHAARRNPAPQPRTRW